MSEMAIETATQDRFVRSMFLRNTSFVTKEDMEIGIVSCEVPEIARAVSSLLSRSLEDAKDTHGGHLPVEIVERTQRTVISPQGVAMTWAKTGYRFVLTRSAGLGWREIVATILVAKDHDTIFFLTGRYNNLRQSTLVQDVDVDQLIGSHVQQRWFDLFAMPELHRYKPPGYHHIVNFVVARECRELGYARALIEGIAAHYVQRSGSDGPLLSGRGLWQIGDPPWLSKMQALGFYHRVGAEQFFLEHPWAPLPPVHRHGKVVTNREYNQWFDLPKLYDGYVPHSSEHHLIDRIQRVTELSINPQAKLQYFQAMKEFT